MAKTCQYSGCDRGCYGTFCLAHKPRKPIKKIGKQGKLNQETSRAFRDSLDPDRVYTCYLQIHPWCPVQLWHDQIVPEHVESKSSSPHLRHNLQNVMIACTYCNGLKGSRSIKSLAKEFPHLEKYLSVDF